MTLALALLTQAGCGSMQGFRAAEPDPYKHHVQGAAKPRVEKQEAEHEYAPEPTPPGDDFRQ